MSEKKKFTVYVGSVVLCVGVAVLLHYVSFTNPYLQSICHLLEKLKTGKCFGCLLALMVCRLSMASPII